MAQGGGRSPFQITLRASERRLLKNPPALDQLNSTSARRPTAFDDVWRWTGAEIIGPLIRVPNANAIAERWVGTVGRQCLDHRVIVGRQDLVHVLGG